MSPLEIHCLLEIYALAYPIKDGQNQHTMATNALLRDGLIVAKDDLTHYDLRKSKFKLTDKGQAHVDHLCNLRLPAKETRWVIPEGPTFGELAKGARKDVVIQRAHDELMNLQPHIAQIPEQYRPFIDSHVNAAMDVLKQEGIST